MTPAPSNRPANAPLQVLRFDTAIRACGHQDDFKILKGERPEWATRRREKWSGKRCTSCVAAETERIKAEAKVRKASKAAFPWQDVALELRVLIVERLRREPITSVPALVALTGVTRSQMLSIVRCMVLYGQDDPYLNGVRELGRDGYPVELDAKEPPP